jgi:putative ABC transport system permease protein
VILRFFLGRELKKFPMFFILLGITILLGTLGLTSISVVSRQVQERLQDRAHDLLTSDFAVSARRDLLPHEREAMEGLLKDEIKSRYRVVDIYSMVTHVRSGQSRLVEIRSVEEGFPFFGNITLKELDFDPEDGPYLSQDLQNLWKISLGDELQVGTLSVKAKDVIKEDSSLGLRGFSLAPRVYLPLSLLLKSGLLKEGSTGSYAYHFKLKDPSEQNLARLKGALYRTIKDPAIKVVLPEDSSEQTGKAIGIISNFMALAALIGLILSLVGIFYLYQSHLTVRLKDLCLMNLYGLSKGSIVLGILGQFTGVFTLTMIVQLLLLLPIYRFVMPLLSQTLGLDLAGGPKISHALDQLPFLYALSLAILTPLLFGLMRTPMGPALKSAKLTMGRFRFYDFIPFLVLLFGFTWALSNSLKIGSIFFFCLMVVLLISTCIIKCLQWPIRISLKGKGLLNPGLETGIALRNLMRSGHRLTLSFLSLAMGATLISLVLQLERMIETELTIDADRPGLFIFDIQEEQLDPLLEFAKNQGTPLGAVTPMIRARLEKVNGEKFARQKATKFRDSREDGEENRGRNTGMNLTSRGGLSASEKIVEGRPFPENNTDFERPAYVSLERRWAQRMGLSIGDKLTFDVQGVQLKASVLNLRDVKWTSFYPNFFVSVEPGFLDGAPKTFLAVLPAGFKDKKTEFQRAAVAEFSNISFINVEEIIGKLVGLFDQSRKAIEIITFLSLGVGLVILYGLCHDQVYRRYYDLALMKGLGMTEGRLRSQLLIEFGALFFFAMGSGLFLGWLMAQLIGIEIFKLPWSIDVARLIWPSLSLSVLCLATILISSWRAVRARPRELLSDS